MWPFSKEQRVAKHTSRIQACFESHEFEDVLPIADKLLALGHTSGFEWKARALARLGRRQEAIRVLQEGVQRAPQVPPLWSHLGEQLSDAGDYAAARAAFARVETFGKPYRDFAIANDAHVLGREGRHEESLARLRDVDVSEDASLRAFVTSSRLSGLLGLKRLDDVIAEADAAVVWMREVREREPDRLGDDLAHVFICAARARWRRDKDAKNALDTCFDAIRAGSRKEAHDLIREIEGLDAARARPFRLMCRGTARLVVDGKSTKEGEPEPHGFFCTYWVLADDVPEGLAFARRVEECVLGDKLISLDVERSEELSDRVAGNKGVYSALGGHIWFRLDEEE